MTEDEQGTPEVSMGELRPQLAAALVEAQKVVETVAKEAQNEWHKYMYASGEAVIEAGRKALNQAGLALLRLGVRRYTIDDSEWARLRVRYLLMHCSGETCPVESEAFVIPGKGRPDDKAEFGVLTELLAYTLRDVLLIRRGDGDENAPSARDDSDYQPPDKERKPRKQGRKAKQQQKPAQRPQQQRQPAAKAESRKQQKAREEPAAAPQPAKPSEAFTKHMKGVAEAPDLAVLETVALCVHDNLKGNEWVQACEALYLRSFELCTDRQTLDTWGKQARNAGLDEETFKRIGQAFRARVKAIREAAEAA